jgi:hypothetical protein
MTSGGIDDRLVDQHDRDVIPNRVDTATLGALQALSLIFEHQRFLASGTDKDVEQLLRNHEV